MFFLSIALPAAGQSIPPEETFFSCLRETFVPDGSPLDSLMRTYESELIGEGILEGPEALDFRGLLQRIASGQRIDTGDPGSFNARLRSLPRDSTAWRRCQLELERFRSGNPDAVLTRFMDRRDILVTEGISAELQASSLLDILGESEFNWPFYRLQTYYLIDLQARAPVNPEVLAESVSEQAARYANRGANVFRVYLNERSQTIVSDRLVDEAGLSELVYRHAREFGPEALYIIDLELDVKYRQFILLKNRITLAVSEVRDQYARRVFGKTFTELSEAESLLLSRRFPIRVVLP
ncbi:hypothetical protein [Robiginitalea sp. SC105]|uniref:hypothetical protein n=1 Tax=Robiginitalea sp. SC105 TaxID=2762332 RepID=UPI00163AC450|nr:hypothetical protein [Robiginitalea sp. SC105]MBC2839993.1 hypothetical protein [Robiginitalea sp. SC105]